MTKTKKWTLSVTGDKSHIYLEYNGNVFGFIFHVLKNEVEELFRTLKTKKYDIFVKEECK